jgi:hypothetical protein
MSDELHELDAEEIEPGAVMFEAIQRWCRRHNDDAPTLVSRVYVIAECHDEEGRWIDRGGFTSDGNEMMAWESMGFLEYARMREDRWHRMELDDCDEDASEEDE